MLNTEINNIRSLVTSGSFSPETVLSVNANLDPTNIQKMLEFAKDG
jgi:hypothetical protein